MPEISAPPVFFCRQCGDCCQGERGILVTPAAHRAMAAFLGLSPEEFAARYLVDTPLGPQVASRRRRLRPPAGRPLPGAPGEAPHLPGMALP